MLKWSLNQLVGLYYKAYNYIIDTNNFTLYNNLCHNGMFVWNKS